MAAKTQAAPVAPRLAPVVLIKGSESLLADRAMSELRRLAHEVDPSLERTDLPAGSYQAGQLDVLTSPSLFGESRMIIISDLENMTDALATDLQAYLSQPAADVWIFLRHPGGNARGKKLLDAIAKAGFPVIAAEPLKNDRDKLDFVRSDVRNAHRKIETEAAQALVDALGNDLSALAAAVAQLLSDVQGTITHEAVRRYYSGRVEATSFEVADAIVGGRSAQALTLVRHAYATGSAPAQLVAAIAVKFRAMAKVSSPAGRKNLGMSPWQAEHARRELRSWPDPALASAITAIAQADEDTKGASKDPEGAVEKLVMTLCRLHRG